MATAEQLKALFRSYSEGDQDRFYSIAIQIAAQEARNGHKKVAEEIRRIIDESKIRYTSRPSQDFEPIPVVQPRGELAGLLSVTYSKIKLSDLVLSEELKRKFERILFEQRQAYKLKEHGLRPRNKILLVGPPGTGKTMTAFALAGEMHLPVFTIRLEGLITKFMGETAIKLRLIFDEINKTKGIFFFDEFDAIGGKRNVTIDVGEIRRILNSFLQFIEQNSSDSLIIGATNHPELLDKALFRRFDDVITYLLPTDKYIEETMRRRLDLFNSEGVSWEKVVSSAMGLSYAELTKICEDVMKESVLSGSKVISTENLIKEISDRKNSHQ